MSPLETNICAEIGQTGPMPFSRFIEHALYDESHGFYARGGAGRRRGDFITSPEVGPLFGVLVAEALDRWWDELGRPDPFTFVEVGAGPGTLARSVLRSSLRCRDALRYITVEPSNEQRAQHPPDVEARIDLPESIEAGVMFANELLDNLPFDLLDHDPDAGWREVRITCTADGFAEVLVPLDVGRHPPPLRAGVRVPDLVAARAFVERALRALQRGRLVVIDYAIDAYPAEHGREWLRTYRGHQRGESPLRQVGSQDVTVDVDLSQLEAVRPFSVATAQAAWLGALGIADLVEEGRRHWSAAASRPDLAALEARSRVREAEALCDPAGLGAFTVVEWVVA